MRLTRFVQFVHEIDLLHRIGDLSAQYMCMQYVIVRQKQVQASKTMCAICIPSKQGVTSLAATGRAVS